MTSTRLVGYLGRGDAGASPKSIKEIPHALARCGKARGDPRVHKSVEELLSHFAWMKILLWRWHRGGCIPSQMFSWLGKHVCFDLALLSTAVAILVVLSSLSGDGAPAAQDLKRPRRILAAVFGVLTSSSFLVLEFAQQPWLWLLALIPTSSVLYQALSLAIFKNKLFFSSAQLPPKPAEGTQAFLTPLMNAAWTEERRYYSTSSLALRFGLPALLLGGVAITTMWCLFNAEFLESLPGFIDPHQKPKVIAAARLGLAGAYLAASQVIGFEVDFERYPIVRHRIVGFPDEGRVSHGDVQHSVPRDTP